MRVEIRAVGQSVDGALQTYIVTRMQFALDRFGERVRLVSVRIADENGPRGGIDKACVLRVQLRGCGKTVVVRERDAKLRALIDRSADRASVACTRALQRGRDWGRADERRPAAASTPPGSRS